MLPPRLQKIIDEEDAKVTSNRAPTREFTPSDGDSGHIGDNKKDTFRVKGGNTPETEHYNNRVDAHPDGGLATVTVAELEARGARVAETGKRGGYNRKLVELQDEDGDDLMKEMVLSGLADPDRTRQSANLERARLTRDFLGYETTGNDYIREQASKRVGRADFAPWEKGKAPDNIYDRRSVIHRAWDRGVDNTKADLGGAINYLGDALGNKELTQIGKEMSQKATNEAKLNPAKIANYTEVDNIGEAFDYLVETLGEQAPSFIVDIIGTVATGGAGATAAIARRAGMEAVKKGVKRGMYAGPVLTGFTQSLGNMENTLEGEGSEVNTGAGFAAGVVGGAVNLAPYALVAGDILKASGLGKKAVKEVVENVDQVEKMGVLDRLLDVGKTTGKASLAEGFTEPAQEVVNAVIESGALNRDLELDGVQIADSAIRALMAGGTMGATASATANMAGAYQQYAAEQEKFRQENLDEDGYDKSYVPPEGVIKGVTEEDAAKDDQPEDMSRGKKAIRGLVADVEGNAQNIDGKLQSTNIQGVQDDQNVQDDVSEQVEQTEEETFQYSDERRAGKVEENGIYGANAISPRDVPNLKDHKRFDEIDALLNPNGQPLSIKEVRGLIDEGKVTEDEINSYLADDVMNTDAPVLLLSKDETSFRNNVIAAKKVLADDALSIRERKSLEDALAGTEVELPADTAEDKVRRRTALHFRLQEVAPGVQEKAQQQKHYDWRKNYQAFKDSAKKQPAKKVETKEAPKNEAPSQPSPMEQWAKGELDAGRITEAEYATLVESTPSAPQPQTETKEAPKVEEKPDGAQQLAAKREEALGVAEWAKAEYAAKRINQAEYKLLIDHSRKTLRELQYQETADDSVSDSGQEADVLDTEAMTDTEVDEETQELDKQYSEKGESTVPDGFSVISDGEPQTSKQVRDNYERRTGALKGLVDDLKSMMGEKYADKLDRMLAWANTPTGDEKRAGAKEGEVGVRAYNYTENGKESKGQKATAKGAKHVPEKTVYHRTLVMAKNHLRKGDYAKAYAVLQEAGLTVDSLEATAPRTIEEAFKRKIESSRESGMRGGLIVTNKQTGGKRVLPFAELVKLSLAELIKQGGRDPSDAETYSKLVDMLQSAAHSAVSTVLSLQDADGNYLYELDVRQIPNDTVVYTAPNNRGAVVRMGALRNKANETAEWKHYFAKLNRQNDLDVQKVLEDESRVKVFREVSGMDDEKVSDDALYALGTKLRLGRKGKANKLTPKETEIYDAIVEIEVNEQTSRVRRTENMEYVDNPDMDSGAVSGTTRETEADNTDIEESTDGLEYATDEGVRPTKGEPWRVGKMTKKEVAARQVTVRTKGRKVASEVNEVNPAEVKKTRVERLEKRVSNTETEIAKVEKDNRLRAHALTQIRLLLAELDPRSENKDPVIGAFINKGRKTPEDSAAAQNERAMLKNRFELLEKRHNDQHENLRRLQRELFYAKKDLETAKKVKDNPISDEPFAAEPAETKSPASDRTVDNSEESGILYSQDLPKEEIDKVAAALEDDKGSMPKGRKIEKNRKLVRGMKRMPKARKRLWDFVRATNSRLKEIHKIAADMTYKFNRDHRILSERLLSVMGKTFANADEMSSAYKDAVAGRDTDGARKYMKLINEINSAVREGDKSFKPDAGKPPIHLDFVKVLDNRKAFMAILEESGIKHADEIAERIFTGEGHSDFDFQKREVGRPARPMSQLAPAYEKLKAAGMIDSDAPRHLARYIHSASKYATWSKMFGANEMVDGEKKFNPSFKMDVFKSEVHPDNREEFDKLIKGITGSLGNDMSPKLRAFNSGAMAFQAATVYLFTAVASIPEIAAIYARSRGLLKGMDKDLNVIFSRMSRQDMLRVAQEFDIVTPNTIEHSVQQMYNMDDLTVGRFSQAVTSTVFKYNGQMWLTRMTRALGVQVGQRFLEAHANTDSDNSRRMLAELGITADEVKTFIKNKDLKSAVGKKYRNALHLFVDESITNPNSSQVPLIMNDPRYAVFTTLKKFFYAFYDNVHKGLYRDAKNRSSEDMSIIYPALLTAAMILPMGMLSELIKEKVKYPMGRPDGKDKSFGEWTYNGLMASGAFGPVHMAEAVYERSGYGANPFIAALGPTADVVWQSLWLEQKATRFMPVVNQLPAAKSAVNSQLKKLVD